jgi:hypothetical protein
LTGRPSISGVPNHRRTDDDWASWYAEWLVRLSELPKLLGARVDRSELTYMLVRSDKEYTERRVAERWEDYYARELIRHLVRSYAISPYISLSSTSSSVPASSSSSSRSLRSSANNAIPSGSSGKAGWSVNPTPIEV